MTESLQLLQEEFGLMEVKMELSLVVFSAAGLHVQSAVPPQNL